MHTKSLFMLAELIPKLSATTTARLQAALILILTILALRRFSLDHHDKILYQMQSTLIRENSIVVDHSLYQGFPREQGQYFEFEEDGEEEVEFYNDEEFY